MKASPDPRIVTGAVCTWWDSIEKAVSNASKATAKASPGDTLPRCPNCGGVLYEFESEEKWWESVAKYAKYSGDETYTGFVTWLRGRCYPDIDTARSVYGLQGRGKRAKKDVDEDSADTLASVLPAALMYDAGSGVTWKRDKIAEVQAKLLAEAGYVLVRTASDEAGSGEPVEVSAEQALLLDVLTASASIAVRRNSDVADRISFIAALQMYFERHGNLVYSPDDPELNAMCDRLLQEIEDRGVALAGKLQQMHTSFFD